jgi:hypothetical protein
MVLMSFYWYVGMLECWNVGMLECWNVGMLECWNVGMLECWNVGMLEVARQLNMYFSPLFHHSNLPLIKYLMGAIQSYLLRG